MCARAAAGKGRGLTGARGGRAGMALAALCAGLVAAASSLAAPLDCTGPGAERRIVLAELFSTDACESCPPAEDLFNRLRAGPELAPVVWHVDYFDGPAWKDRFALPAAARRQQALARAQGLKVVATPQVFVDGLESGDWRDARALRQCGDFRLRAAQLRARFVREAEDTKETEDTEENRRCDRACLRDLCSPLWPCHQYRTGFNGIAPAGSGSELGSTVPLTGGRS